MADEVKRSTTFGNVSVNVHDQGQSVLVNEGEININHQYGGKPVTQKQVIDGLISNLPADLPEAKRKEVAAAVEPLRSLAELPVEEQNTPGVMEQARTCLAALEPYKDSIARGLIGSLSAGLGIAARSWPVLGVVLAGLDAVKGMFDTDTDVDDPAAA